MFLAAATAAVAAASSGGIAVDNPLVLGPLAAFIFAVFVSEIVVSGKAYKREVAENQRLRETVERVVPLAERMVEATESITRVTEAATVALREVAQRQKSRRDA